MGFHVRYFYASYVACIVFVLFCVCFLNSEHKSALKNCLDPQKQFQTSAESVL